MMNGKTLIPLLATVCFVISGSIPATCDEAAAHPLMFVGNFENGGLRQFGDSQLEHALKKSEIVTKPVREGKHALKLTLDRTAHQDMQGHRTDFWIRGMSENFNMGGEYWYGFSTYFPASWQPDTQSELFAQWIGWRDYGPSLAIYIYGDDYCIKKRWAAGGSYRNLWKGKVAEDKGKWVDWVFRVRWSANKDGFIEVWKNGEKILADTGRNCGVGEFAPYFKFGIYKWPWKESQEESPSTVTKRTLYIDEIRIGDESASFTTVSPLQTRRMNQKKR
ncbi:MAG: polysaccharide lyase [Verrucomicrobiota bacterium]